MEIQISDLYPNRDECPETDFLYHAITDTLRSSKLSDSQAKSQAIANSVFFLCTTSSQDSEDIIWQFADVIVHIYSRIPDDHDWQDILADAVIKLRGWPMHESKLGRYGWPKYSWEELFPLYMFIVDFRQCPDFEHSQGQELRDSIIDYQRLTSFAARLLGRGYTERWMNCPIQELSSVLGRPQVKEVDLDCRLFSATEWILHAADPVYTELCSWQKEWEKAGCENYGNYSRPDGSALEKWRTWTVQLSEFEANWHKWGFEDTTQERIRKAVKEMKAVEERHVKRMEHRRFC